MKKYFFPFLFTFALWVPFFCFAKEPSPWKNFHYSVLRVFDGDTLLATDGNVNFKVRIAALDAPERAQPYGKIATEKLSHLIGSEKIQIEPIGAGHDMYGRVLGHVYVQEKNIALMMITEGFAYYYRPTCEEFPLGKQKYNYDPTSYVTAEKNAAAEHRGLWRNSREEWPCKFRKRAH